MRNLPNDRRLPSATPRQLEHAVRFRKAAGDEPFGAPDGARPAGPPADGGRRRRGRGA